jgi:hypothetical protein
MGPTFTPDLRAGVAQERRAFRAPAAPPAEQLGRVLIFCKRTHTKKTSEP